MKILVLSDSHAALSFMRFAIQKVRPDHVVHLGDHYDDGVAISEENPHIIFHQVPGNCDRYRCDPYPIETLCYDVCGVRLLMTHGHKYFVKTDLYRVLAEGRRHSAAAVLFGHTHEPLCYCDEDGMWVMNPGTCGTYGGSVGLVEAEDKKISACRILRQAELEEL